MLFVRQYAISCLFCLWISYSQAQNFFELFQASRGFPYTNVAALTQDKLGFIWLGTSEGLVRYDGIRFQVFTHIEKDSSSLPDNNINCLYADRAGNLWVGTRHGLACYDPVTNRFKNFYHSEKDKNTISEDEVWSVAEDNQNNIWVGTLNGGLNRFKPLSSGHQITRILHDVNKTSSLSNNTVWTISFDASGNGWAGTEGGLNRFDPTSKAIVFERFQAGGEIGRKIGNDLVWRICQDQHQNTWIVSLNGTIDVITPSAPGSPCIIFPLTEKLNQFLQMPVNEIYDIAFDRAERLWIAANNGLSVRMSVQRTAAGFSFSNLQKFSQLNDAVIWKLFKDNRHMMWIGMGKGAALYDGFKESLQFGTDKERQRLTGKLVTDIQFANNTSFFIVANDSLFLTQNGLVKYVSCGNASITDVCYEATSGLWAGGPLGLFYASAREANAFVEGKQRALTLQPVKKIPDFPDVKRINFFSRQGSYLFVGGGGHLGAIGLTDNTYMNFDWIGAELEKGAKKTFRCVCFYDHTLWLGTDNGLYKYDIVRKKQERALTTYGQPALLANRITTLIRHNGKLWIGTPNGLDIFDEQKNELRSLTTIEGLPDNYIKSLADTPEGDIWLATRNGLVRHNEKRTTYQLYTTANGLASNQLNKLTMNHDQHMLYIATDEGINALNLAKKAPMPAAPPIAFTDFLIHGTSILQNNPSLAETFRQRGEMKLNYLQNYFTVHFTALSYSSAVDNKYAYKLEGFDTGWIYTQTPSATFTNLSAGTYKLWVRAANSYGVWNNEGLDLTIVVTPPWWQTNIFYFSCIALAGGLIFTIYKIRLNRILADQKMRNKIASDLHDDIGSSLSGIAIYSEIAKAKTAGQHPELYRMISAIVDNTKITQQNMQDIVWSINPYNDSFDKTITRMKLFAAEMMEPKGIQLHFQADETLSDITLSAATRKNFFLIFKEVINNCAKYAACNKVLVSINRQGNKVVMQIEDDGKGFNTELCKKGNGLQTMQFRAAEMKGTLQLDSKPGDGTRVKLVFTTT